MSQYGHVHGYSDVILAEVLYQERSERWAIWSAHDAHDERSETSTKSRSRCNIETSTDIGKID